MSLSSWRAVIGMVCVLALATGCASPPKTTKAGAAVPQAAAPAAPAKAQTPAAPARPKDIFSALQNASLKLQPGDKVWVVSAEGYKARDVRDTRAAEDAFRRIVTQRDKATVVAGNLPALAAVLERYQTETAALITDDDLVKAARTAGVTKVIVFKAVGLAPTEAGAPFIAPTAAENPMSVEARVIDVASGKVIAAVEAGTAPAPVAAEAASGTRAYPLRVTDPEYVSRPDVPKAKPESDLLGRRFRAYTRVNDQIGPAGLYNNPDYQNLTRFSDEVSPFPFYSGDSTMFMITTTPPNARVFVNTQDTALTPCWLPLEEGDKIVLYKEGYIQEEFRVPAKRGAIHVNLRMK